MTARAVGKQSQGQHKHHMSPGLEKPSLQILQWKRPTELHRSQRQPGLPAVMTHLLCIWTTVDFCKCYLTLLMSHIHPPFAELGWACCLVSKNFTSSPLEDAFFPSDSRGNKGELRVQIPQAASFHMCDVLTCFLHLTKAMAKHLLYKTQQFSMLFHSHKITKKALGKLQGCSL